MERSKGWKEEEVVVNLFGRKMLVQAQRDFTAMIDGRDVEVMTKIRFNQKKQL